VQPHNLYDMKQCTKCNEIKELLDFSRNRSTRDGLECWCKKCKNGYHSSEKARKDRTARENTPEFIEKRLQTDRIRSKTDKFKETRKKYNEKEEVKEKTKTYRQKPEAKAARNALVKERRKTDPLFKMSENIKRAVRQSIKRGNFTKLSSINMYLGCSMEEFRIHIELQFSLGMSWDNYGFGMDKWNIDHFIPLASANSAKELFKLNHYSNLRPMWQTDNLKKSNKIPTANLKESIVGRS